jgi:hypothetical protein
MGKTILDLGVSEATITDPSTYFIETQKTGETVTKQTVLTKLITYLQTLFAEKFDASNTSTGTTSVTINAKSGVATFTASVGADTSPTSFTINNTSITASSKINLNLSYFPSGDEMCAISAYKASNGSVLIYFTNYSAVNADEPKIVSFQILN